MILKVIGSLLIFHTLTFADTSIVKDSKELENSKVINNKSVMVKDTVKASFGKQSVVYMLILTSLLGTFFLKDELADSI